MLVIESTAVSLTAVLLNELIKKKVAIVFCDEKRNPASEVLPLYGSHNSSKRCREQADWSKEDVYKRQLMNVLSRQLVSIAMTNTAMVVMSSLRSLIASMAVQ